METKLATTNQKWAIANRVQQMARDANERSPHGKAFRAAALGFTFYQIRTDLSSAEASQTIKLLDSALELFGTDDTAVFAAAEQVSRIKSRG